MHCKILKSHKEQAPRGGVSTAECLFEFSCLQFIKKNNQNKLVPTEIIEGLLYVVCYKAINILVT